MSSTSATTLTRQDDGSVVSTNSNGLGGYQIRCITDQKHITALRLEVLPDDRSPPQRPRTGALWWIRVDGIELRAAPSVAQQPRELVKGVPITALFG
ncbi:MAG: hypothetical protein AB7F89_19260 [Pirellulaceae bacterium]